MRIAELINKARSKGLKHSARLLFQICVFSHWKLYLLERPLAQVSVEVRQPLHLARIEPDNLKLFEKYLSHYIPSIRVFLQQGSHPQVCVNEHQDAYLMFWVHEGGDYYDRQLYKCRIPVPEDCIYQFAGELAKEYRPSRHVIYLLQQVWNQYCERGFTRTRSLVNANNPRALRIHQKLGFAETGTVIHVYRLFGVFSFARYEISSENNLNVQPSASAEPGEHP